MAEKERSPFTPGTPVPHELFVGRVEQIQELLRCAREVKTGKPQSVFLIGDRGIGKSSFASFVRYYLCTRENFLGVHVFPGATVSLEETVRQVFDQLLKQTRTESWFSELKSMFGKHIKELGLFGVTVAFSPPQEDLQQLVRSFDEALRNTWEKVKDNKSGIFIVLDDLNALVEKTHFANWYKSFADKAATTYPEFPILVMLVGLPEQRKRLAEQQQSLMRIFRIVTIDKLSDEEVGSFCSRAFKNAGMQVRSDALSLIVRYSSGLPVLMHEIGDAAFWRDEDGVIDIEDATKGVLDAAKAVGKKYLDPKVYDAFLSERYKSILDKLGRDRIKRSFTKQEAERGLGQQERDVLHNFLQKLQKLGIIEHDPEKGRGCYRFVNELYPVYIRMQAAKRERKSSKRSSPPAASAS